MYVACLFTLVNFITSFKNLALYQIEDLKNAFLHAISVIANDNLS